MAEKTGQEWSGSQAGSASEFAKENDYDCKPWLPDSSVFKVPSNITFEDTTQSLQELSKSLDSFVDQACKLCDMIPGAAEKAECKAKACK